MTDLDQVRADVRARLAGLTRREITRATVTAKDSRDVSVWLRDRHGDTFKASAEHATAVYDEHAVIWRSMNSKAQDAVYAPVGAPSAA